MKNFSKFLLGTLLSTLLFTSAFAQTKVISGVVKDIHGIPLPGVNVLLRQSKTGTITDINGVFKLSLKGEEDLVFSFIGMKTKRVLYADITPNMVVTLKENIDQLDEIVIVGYGAVNKSDIAGSVEAIKIAENNKTQYQTVDQLLQGRISGVQVTGNLGQGGGAMNVNIRGINSIYGSNQPLYVIDGVIVSTAGDDTENAFSDQDENQGQQSAIAGLNPRDIQSVEVLKDAASTAIYGSRGANGVVLITTKMGAKSKAVINTFINTDIVMINSRVDLLGAKDYAIFQNNRLLALGNRIKYQIDGDDIYLYNNGSLADEPLEKTNWHDAMFKPSVAFNAGLNVSGGTEKTKYYISGGFSETKGVIETANLKKGDFRLNLQSKLSDKITIDARTSFMYSQGSFLQSGSWLGSARSFIQNVNRFAPLNEEVDWVNDDGDVVQNNPYKWLTGYEDRSETMNITTGLNLTYAFSKELKYQLRAGGNSRLKNRMVWYDNTVGKGVKNNGTLGYTDSKRYTYTLENMLMYVKKIGKNHKINSVVGITYDGVHTLNSGYEYKDYKIQDLATTFPQTAKYVVVYPYQLPLEESVLSGLGRITYSFKGRYTLTGTFRADGSSKFQNENKFGYFPSVAASWIINKESFMEGIEQINNLKLRASWGITGNQAIRPYQTQNNFGNVYYVNYKGDDETGMAQQNIPNANLSWETTTQMNIGLDYALFDGFINGSIDVYDKHTTNLFQRIQTPSSSGFQSYYDNRGELRNRGIDINIDVLALAKNDFTLSVGGNISFVRSEMLNLGVPQGNVMVDGAYQDRTFVLGKNVSSSSFNMPANIYMEGSPIGMFWGYETAGVYSTDANFDEAPTILGKKPQMGDVIFVDQNKDGVINTDDLTNIGDPNPDFVYGLNINASYKKLKLNMFWSGMYGNEIANGNLHLEEDATAVSNIRKKAYFNAWTPDNQDTTYPRLDYPRNLRWLFTDRIIEDGSFLRLSQVTLSYDMSLPKLGVDNLNIYLTGRNLLTLTNYSGYDPEITSKGTTITGVDWNSFPNARIYTLGFNMKF